MWIYRWLDRVFAVIGAFLLSQFPQFYEQYLQRAMGHLAELQYQVAAMQQAAGLTGKSLEEYIKKFLASPDQDFAHQGGLMQGMIDRAQQLAEGITALADANILTRPFTFLAKVQSDIATSTLQHFHPGISFTLESLLYAFLGIVLGYGLLHTVAALFLGLYNLIRKPFRKQN